jgi:heme/copper-type cytochrome/quinol oxidase subunit 3
VQIPYALDVRPDTGFSNGTLAMWLFLASEVMLFGALFSGYALLRTGSVVWPQGSERLGVALASLNTVILLGSGATMAAASRAASARRVRDARSWLAATVLMGLAFLAIEASEWGRHLAAGQRPASDTFFAVYYTLTGVHMLHVIGGLAVIGCLAARAPAHDANRLAVRVGLCGMYWHFVDVVWLFLFATVYLL